jgi:quercetin dioxygenase-like cupin family protein
MRSVRWADIPQLSTRGEGCPAAWQQYWQQPRPNSVDPRPSVFQAGLSPVGRRSCERNALSSVADACRWLLLLLSLLLSDPGQDAFARLPGVRLVTACTVEGMARILARPAAREDTAMGNEQAAPETKGVTVELLAVLDLGPEIEGMAGRQLRMRMVTIEPGGVFGPVHDHIDRPGMVYILQGTITDHRDGAATEYGPGVGWPEDKDTTHWLENRERTSAVEISVDIVRAS